MRLSDSEALAPPRVAWALFVVGVMLVACSRDRSPPSAATPADPAAQATPSERVVNLYNWFEYISPEVLEAFTAETGIRVNLDTFDSAEMLEARLFAGRSGYDVVVTNGNFLERQIASGVSGKLDRGRLPGLANLDPTLTAQIASDDSGNTYAVGYNFGSVGIGYDSKKVAARTGRATVDSWGLVYDPAQASRFADCGITIIDSPVEPALFSEHLSDNEQMPDNLLIDLFDAVNVPDMLFWHDQNVRRRLRMDVIECDGVIIFLDQLGGNLFFDDSAENTVRIENHVTSPPLPVQSSRRNSSSILYDTPVRSGPL